MHDNEVILPPHLTASERLILMFLELHYQRHMKGASRAQIISATGVGGRTFERCWKRLEGENLVISERLFLLTQEGQRLAQQLSG